MSEKIRVGLVGLGVMGQVHFGCYKNNPHCEIVAVADTDAAKLKGDAVAGNIVGASALDLTGIRATTNFDELLDDPNIDVLDFCLPTPQHNEYSIRALQAGKHVVCEKPMARTLAECDQMMVAAHESGKFLMFGHCLRYWPQYVEAHKILQSGELGKPLYARLMRAGGAPVWSAWLCDNAQSGGAILDTHIHDIDTALWWFGKPQSVEAQGFVHDGLSLKVHVMWGYDDGPVVSLYCGWDRNGGPFSMAFEVICEGGTVAWDSSLGEELEVRVAGETRKIVCDGVSGYQGEIDDFLRCIREGQAPTRVTPESSRLSTEIALQELQQVEDAQIVNA